MRNRYTTSNFYTTTISSWVVLTPSGSWSTTIPVVWVPSIAEGKLFHVIFKPTDAINRMVVRAYISGWLMKVDNVDIPTAKTYLSQSQVAIFDVAEMFNAAFSQLDDFGYVEYYGNSAKIRWGYVYYNWTQHNFSDIAMTALADWTWYAVLDYTDNTLKFTQVYAYSTQLRLWKLVITSGVIVYTDERGTENAINKSILDWFSESWGNLLYKGNPVWGWPGTGDVIGPSSAVDWNIAVFDGLTGKIVKDGGKTISEIINLIPTIKDIWCKVYQNTPTTLSTSWVSCVFQLEEFDTDTMHDNSTNNTRITFITAGKYMFWWSITIADTSAHSIRILQDWTTVLCAIWTSTASSNPAKSCISWFWVFTAWQYIELQGYVNRNTSWNSETNFRAYKVW
jgi:hypothetical protein